MSINRIPGSASPDDVAAPAPARDDDVEAQEAARDRAQAKADLEAETERMQARALDATRPALTAPALDVAPLDVDPVARAAADRTSWTTDHVAEASHLAFDGIGAEVRAAEARTDWTSTQAQTAADERARIADASSKVAADTAARDAAMKGAAESGASLSRDDDAERQGERDRLV